MYVNEWYGCLGNLQDIQTSANEFYSQLQSLIFFCGPGINTGNLPDSYCSRLGRPKPYFTFTFKNWPIGFLRKCLSPISSFVPVLSTSENNMSAENKFLLFSQASGKLEFLLVFQTYTQTNRNLSSAER